MESPTLLITVSLITVTCMAIGVVASGYFLRKRTSFSALRGSSYQIMFKLIDKKYVSLNVRRFRFELPSNDHVLGLPVGKHITVSAEVPNPTTGKDPKWISRQYTPITSDFLNKGYFDLLVKVYKKNEHPRFPEGGWMSQYLDSLEIGSLVNVSGPSGRLEYLGNGNFRIGERNQTVSDLGMIAGGTGITPMFQIIQHVLKAKNGQDSLDLSLLYGNQHPGDILLKNELEDLARDHPKQFEVFFTVDRFENGDKWTGFQGFVDADMIRASMPPPSPGVLILLCGPYPMLKSVQEILSSLGYSKDMVQTL